MSKKETDIVKVKNNIVKSSPVKKFRPMPIMYLEMVENKDKVFSDKVNAEYTKNYERNKYENLHTKEKERKSGETKERKSGETKERKSGETKETKEKERKSGEKRERKDDILDVSI